MTATEPNRRPNPKNASATAGTQADSATPISGRKISASSRPMSRDKADTLLLLAACVLVLASHVIHLAWWISLACGSLLLWRSWITFRGNRMPPRWLLLPLAGLAMAGVYWSHQTFFGREAGVAMLVLLLALKLLEMRARRDLFVVVFLSFFLILTTFFYSQSIVSAATMIVAVILMLSAQLSFQFTGSAPPLFKRLRLGALIVALALPLTLVLFLLFPRIEGPLWGLPGDAQSGRSGLSDSMAPGNISQLVLSTEIAFRAKFFDRPPSQSALYWRGPVLGDFDGRTWTALASSDQGGERIEILQRGAPVRYQVTLEPSGRRSVFALELPREVPELDGMQVDVAPDMQLLARSAVNQRIRYEAISYPDYVLQPNQSDAVLNSWRTLPAGYNPATMEFAARLRQQHPGDEEFVNAVLRHFRAEEFRYTLEPPGLGRHGVDDFLFKTRAGFCEHYAGAFVVLMRAAGLPARVVTGYQGGEVNTVDGFMTVRQSDAHAWTEVWIAQRGWMRVDPTSAVAPNRIEQNLQSALPANERSGLIGDGARAPAWLAPLKSLRRNWEALNNGWNQWVLDYSPQRQRDFIESLGLGPVNWRTLTMLMLAIGALVTLMVVVPLARNRKRIDPVEALYHRLSRQLSKDGYERALHEGPRAYRQRITAEKSRLAPERQLAAAQFLKIYEAIRYSQTGKNPAAAISQLKALLAKCR